MNANELRLGNFVELPSFNGKGENIIADLNYHTFFVTSTVIKDAEYYGKDWAGRAIPLTEDWLLKFGFKVSRDNSYPSDERKEKGFVINEGLYGKLSDYFRVYWRNEAQKIWVDELWPHKKNDQGSNYFLYVNQSYVMGINYVHQLQNLFFTLTGEELTIK